jgi:hypothetical protein
MRHTTRKPAALTAVVLVAGALLPLAGCGKSAKSEQEMVKDFKGGPMPEEARRRMAEGMAKGSQAGAQQGAEAARRNANR